MAQGLKYPKEMTKDVVIHVPKEMDIRFHDCLRDFAIVPYFGFWGVCEILYNQWGAMGKGKLSFTRLIESFPTMELAKAFLEGFMAGDKNRKPFPENQNGKEENHQEESN